MASWVNWFFVDRSSGRIVIGQKPNVLMLVFIAATAARLASPGGSASRGAAVRATQAGALLLWSLDEMLRGVNPFRRLGGALVLVAAPFRTMLR